MAKAKTKKKATKKAAPKPKKGTLGHMREVVRVVTTQMLHDLVRQVGVTAERARSSWPWASEIDPTGGIDGYSARVYVYGGPGRGGRDVSLCLGITADVSDAVLEQLVKWVSNPEKAEWKKNDYQWQFGHALINCICVDTDVTVSMTKRTAAEAVSHCQRYETLSLLGLQLDDMVGELLFPSPAAKLFFDTLEASS